MRKFIGSASILSLLILAAPSLNAETLPIEGIYPAGSDRLSALNTIAIGSFSGREGPSLAIALEQGLRDVRVRGAPYFSIVSYSRNSRADGRLTGSASSRTESRREVVRMRVCSARNANGKCVEHRLANVGCTRRNITLSYTLSAVGRRGERLYSVSKPAVHSGLICPDTTGVPPVDVVVAQLVSSVANELRIQFAPNEVHEDIRVKEGLSGLQGNAKSKFKQAVKLTKRNVTSACEVWLEVDQLVPDHAPTLFNIGLCAEARRDYNGAETYYRRVLNFDRSETYATQAIERLNQRRHAERQIAAHSGGGRR